MSTNSQPTKLTSCERDILRGFISFGSFSVLVGQVYAVHGPLNGDIKRRFSAVFLFSSSNNSHNVENPCLTFIYYVEKKAGIDDIFLSNEFACGCLSSDCEQIFMKVSSILSMTNTKPKEIPKPEIETALKNIGFDFSPILEHLLYFST